jgi:cytochrome c553
MRETDDNAFRIARRTLFACLFVALTACGQREASPGKPAAPPAAAADPAAGQSIAERHCFGCHRADGSGAAPGMPRLARQNAAYLAEAMQHYAAGRRPHAVLKEMTPKLSEADIRNVAAYYAGLPALAAATARPAEAPSAYERGKAAAAACAGCHGVDGNSKIAGTPSLAGQQPIYLLSALAEYHRGDRGKPGLASMLASADKVELESLALYYATQSPAQRPLSAVGDAAAGEAIALRCSGCHGARGISSDAATPMLAGQDAQYLVKALRGYGKDRHHGSMQRQFGALGEQDLRNLAAYYASQPGRPAQSAQDPVAQMAEKCDRCHGDAAGQAQPTVPRLRGQDKDYLVLALRAYRDDRRESSTMHKMSMPFGEAAIDGIAAYYAGQPGR